MSRESASEPDGESFTSEVSAGQEGKRLDVLLAELASNALAREISRAQAARWIADGRVRVNDKPCVRPSTKLERGAVVSASVPVPRTLELSPDASIELRIVHEDSSVLVLDKQPGVSVHPGAGRQEGTLVNALLHHFGNSISRIGDALRPGIVHRLDKDTSGLLAVAKTEGAFRSLQKQLRPPRTMKRIYTALVYSLPRAGKESTIAANRREGIISAPIARHPSARTKMAVVVGGRESTTRWRLLEELAGAYLLELELETGRTHQIRVHLAHAGAPIVGDALYGHPPRKLTTQQSQSVERLARQALHASRLAFVHPETEHEVVFESPLPPDVVAVLEAFAAPRE